jgi:hypothetical protein
LLAGDAVLLAAPVPDLWPECEESGSKTWPTACFTLWAAWLTAWRTPGAIAYAKSIAAIPTVAASTARRARLVSWATAAGFGGGATDICQSN